MKRALLALAACAAAATLFGADAPPPPAEGAPAAQAPAGGEPSSKTEDGTPPKHRLSGGFKGRAVGATGGEAAKSTPKPAAAPKKSAPALVIDNRMVRSAAGASASPTRGAPPPPPPSAPPPPVEMPKIVDLQGHDEAYWRAKAAAIRDGVQKAEEAVAAAEAEEKREETDFYAWDDGQYRDNVIKPAWDRAKEEAAKARAGLEAARKDLDGLEDEARRAGAFPGWIR